MLLSLWLCVVPVIAENTIQPHTEADHVKPYNCGNEEVLLKVWTILSNILDADGKTVKIPSRSQIQYALTLIKKHILENIGSQNVDLQEKLFLREAELAKYKGVYLNDNRSLQNLLDLELIPNDDDPKVVLKYELPANDKPGCREEFRKLIQIAHEDYTRLANSPVCSDDNVEAWISNPSGPFDVHPSVYENNYNPANNLEISFNSKNEYDTPAAQNLNALQTGVNTMFAETPKPSRAIPELNNPIKTNLLNIVKLSTDRINILGQDFTAKLEHAKNVADRIKTLYQSNNIQKDFPFKLDLSRGQSLRDLNKNFGTFNIGLVNNQPPKPLMQASYVNQIANMNPQNNNFYKSPYSIRNPDANQSYTITNILQSNNTVIENGNTSPQSTFINSKYHPNPHHSYEETPKIEQSIPIRNLEDLPRQSYRTSLNVNSLYKYPTPYNIAAKFPGKGEFNKQPKSNSFNYDVYRYSKPNYVEHSKTLQNNYPYQPSSNPYNIYFNYNPNLNQPNLEVSSVQPTYATENKNNALKQVIHNINAPHPQLHKEIFNKPDMQSYKYTGLNHVQNNNVPNQLTHQALNYDNQPVIDKLADWIAGTNPSKLNSGIGNNQGEIELTYLVKEPPPVLYQPRIYFIKFRLPYKAFAKHLSEFLNPHSSLRSSDVDLYKDLASQFNATVIPSDLSQIPKEHISNLEDKRLVRARYIDPNLPGKDDNLKSVDIINFANQTESNNANVANFVINNVAPNAQIPLQPPQ